MKLLAAALLLITNNVQAEKILISYTGSVTSLTYADCQSYNNGSCSNWIFNQVTSSDFAEGNRISVSKPFSGSFVYEANTSLSQFSISSDGHQASYLNGVVSSEFTTDQLSLPASWLPFYPYSGFSIVNNRSDYFGTFDAFNLTGIFDQANWFATVNLFLSDNTASVFDGFDVPHTLDFSDFQRSAFSVGLLRRTDGDQLQLSGTLSSVVFSSASPSSTVPEPSSIVLLLTGVCGLIASWKRFPRR